MKKLGGKKLFQDDDHSGGTVSYVMPLGKSERWFEISIANAGHAFTFNIIEVPRWSRRSR